LIIGAEGSIFFRVSQTNASLEKRRDKGRTTTQQEANRFFVPVIENIVDFSGTLAFLLDLVHGEICSEVPALGQILEFGDPGFDNFRYRTTLRAGLTDEFGL